MLSPELEINVERLASRAGVRNPLLLPLLYAWQFFRTVGRQ